ncbi:helix-turn-helix domain-containing protein [Paenibacillus sp. Soil787]|uniref:helix-turn-helix domain-containing protein n=1 Tax=Paenibacillus sp. Soil787 TaxID=1736411 RepID=UPI0009E88EAF
MRFKIFSNNLRSRVVSWKADFRKHWLLLETNLPLTVIAERIGFKHTEYMSVVFKRATGIRPGQFRQQNKH